MGGLDAAFRPKCRMIGESGNIFNLMGIARRALCDCGYYELADEMGYRIMHGARSYEEALFIIQEYVDIY